MDFYLTAVPAKAGTHLADDRAVSGVAPGFRRECSFLFMANDDLKHTLEIVDLFPVTSEGFAG
jgi:hypothetical protein